jgi:hypothetical protein
MVNPVSTGGYQSYSYQQATTPVQETPRSGTNRIEKRDAPAADSQRADRRELASRDDRRAELRSEASEDRGRNLDVTV